MSGSPEARGEGGFVDVDKTRIYLEAWGAAGKPVLLCLHGLGGGTHFFAARGTALRGQCRTVALDLPGSGLSPPLPSFSFDAVAELMTALARSEHLQGPAVCLLGHSMGTILALEMIRRSPDLAAGLIIVGGLPEAPAPARTRILDRVHAIGERGLAGVAADVVAANFSRRSQAERPELTACFAKLFARQDAVAYADTASALADWRARDLPPLDRVLCLAVTGEEDRYASPSAISSFARALPPGTQVEILRDCGHLPFLEQPGQLATIVASFLRKRCGFALSG